MPKLTPLYSERPKSVRDTLSGQFVLSGPTKTADVLEGAGVSKRRPMNEHELYVRNKVAQYGGASTAALGLAALGTRGAAGAMRLAPKAAKGLQATGRLGTRAEPTLTRLVAGKKPLKIRAKKLERTSNTLGTIGFGTGSITGINSSQLAGDNARRHRMAKNYGGTMDFGLGGVQQGVEISKKDWQNISEHQRRARDSRRSRERAMEVAGLGGTAISSSVLHRYYTSNKQDVGEQAVKVGRQLHSSGKQIYSHRKLPMEARRPFNAAALKSAGTAIRSNPHGSVALGGAAVMAGGAAVAGGYRLNEKRHDVAIARQRKTRATTPVGKAAGFSRGSATFFRSKTPGHWVSQQHGPKTPFNNRSLKALTQDSSGKVVARYNHRATLNRTGKIAVGTGGSLAVLGGAEAARRKVKKSYDPERSRKRRVRAAGDAGFAGAGLLAAGGVAQGRKSYAAAQGYRAGKEYLGHKPEHFGSTETSVSRTLASTRNDLHSTRAALGETQKELRNARGAHKAGVTAIKHGGKAAAFGIGATGLAMGAGRIRSYSKGRGRSYQPLRTIEY